MRKCGGSFGQMRCVKVLGEYFMIIKALLLDVSVKVVLPPRQAREVVSNYSYTVAHIRIHSKFNTTTNHNHPPPYQ